MRAFVLTIALLAGAVGLTLATPSKAQARWWRGGYYNSYYYPGYAYGYSGYSSYYPGYAYGTAYTPYASYAYTPYRSYYYPSYGYSSYAFGPTYGSTYYGSSYYGAPYYGGYSPGMFYYR